MNNKGFQIKSFWEGDEAICEWPPQKHHMAAEGVLCGGVVSTIIDCHCLNTAIAAVYKNEGREIGTKPFIPYITKTLQVNLLIPISTASLVALREKIKEMREKKTIVACSVFSNSIESATCEIIAIRVPEAFWVK